MNRPSVGVADLTSAGKTATRNLARGKRREGEANGDSGHMRGEKKNSGDMQSE
jgi:hypothetical protein